MTVHRVFPAKDDTYHRLSGETTSYTVIPATASKVDLKALNDPAVAGICFSHSHQNSGLKKSPIPRLDWALLNASVKCDRELFWNYRLVLSLAVIDVSTAAPGKRANRSTFLAAHQTADSRAA
jgi:hypothetical protein